MSGRGRAAHPARIASTASGAASRAAEWGSDTAASLQLRRGGIGVPKSPDPESAQGKSGYFAVHLAKFARLPVAARLPFRLSGGLAFIIPCASHSQLMVTVRVVSQPKMPSPKRTS